MFQKKIKQIGRQVYDGFFDDENGLAFRRFLCSISWPYGDKPGFVLVIGEDLEPDFSLDYNPRHIRVLDEFEDLSLEELYRACLKFSSQFPLDSVLGNQDDPLYDIWEKIDHNNGLILTLRQPNDIERITPNFVVQLIKKYARKKRKTLHFGQNSKLPAHIDALTADAIEASSIEKMPAIAALGYLLAELQTYSHNPYEYRDIMPEPEATY